MTVRNLRFLFHLFLILSAITTPIALYHAFVVAPPERSMGDIQRIFYFHVGSAIAGELCVGLVFVASVSYLATNNRLFDLLSCAAGEVAFLLCSIVLLSGTLWAHTAWNVWFRFEPRLVTFLLLWFILFSFVLLRTFGEPGKIPAHSAILGIIGTITVPIMIYSIKLLPASAQLHPQVIEHRGLKDPMYVKALIISTVALCFFSGCLIVLRTRIERIRLKIEDN